MNYNSSKNQTIKDKFVRQNVIYCVSTLVYELRQRFDRFDEYSDSILEAFETDPDWEECASADGWEEFEDGFYKPEEDQYYMEHDGEVIKIYSMDKPEIEEKNLIEEIYIEAIEDEYDTDDPDSVLNYLQDNDIINLHAELYDSVECNFDITYEEDWEQLCLNEGLDYDEYRSEVYEHWIVSEYLARNLENRGQKILWDFFGMTVWCRCTTGQAILLDHCISLVCEDMEILEGQKNEWKV